MCRQKGRFAGTYTCFMFSLRFNCISAKLPAQKWIWLTILTTLSKENHFIPSLNVLLKLMNLNFRKKTTLSVVLRFIHSKKFRDIYLLSISIGFFNRMFQLVCVRGVINVTIQLCYFWYSVVSYTGDSVAFFLFEKLQKFFW